MNEQKEGNGVRKAVKSVVLKAEYLEQQQHHPLGTFKKRKFFGLTQTFQIHSGYGAQRSMFKKPSRQF